MLGGRGEAGEIGSLEPAHLGFGEAGADPRVFARSLGDAAPAGVAGDVEHRREGEVDAGGGALLGGGAGRRLPERGVEGAGLRERDREDGAEAVQNVEAEEERNAEAAFLDRRLLRGAHGIAAPEVEEAADRAGAHVGAEVARDDRTGGGEAGAQHRQLAELLGERHRGDELGIRGAGGAGVEAGKPGGGGDHGEEPAAVEHHPGR